MTTGQKILQPHPVLAADEHLELFLGVNPKGGGSRFPFPLSVACKHIQHPLSHLQFLLQFNNVHIYIKKLLQEG